MILATFNVNSIRARMPIIQKWLSSSKPDVVCIQETKVRDEEFPIDDIESTGYNAIFKGEKSYNGVAVLSLHKIENVSYGFDGEGNDEGPRLITVKIQGIHIVNTYIPQGTSPDSEKFQYKLKFFQRLGAYFSDNYKKSSSLIWTGDFNVAPEPIDVHNPKRLLGNVGYHPDEHEALKKVKEWGFVDVFRMHKPEGDNYTFWDYRVRDGINRGLGWRVDHIWATKKLADSSVDSWIEKEPRTWEKPSDHTPLLAKFNV